MLERTCVRVFLVPFVLLCASRDFFPCVNNEGEREDKQNERAANSAGVSHQDFWVAEKDDDDDRWNREDRRPDAFDEFAVILNI